MASHIYLHALGAHVDQPVELRGWVRAKRSSGKLHFITLRDGRLVNGSEDA